MTILSLSRNIAGTGIYPGVVVPHWRQFSPRHNLTLNTINTCLWWFKEFSSRASYVVGLRAIRALRATALVVTLLLSFAVLFTVTAVTAVGAARVVTYPARRTASTLVLALALAAEALQQIVKHVAHLQKTKHGTWYLFLKRR